MRVCPSVKIIGKTARIDSPETRNGLVLIHVRTHVFVRSDRFSRKFADLRKRVVKKGVSRTEAASDGRMRLPWATGENGVVTCKANF